MMSINKMLIGGAAVFATVSLIGCKDDDNSDSCDGVDETFTFSGTGAGFVPATVLASNEDCLKCFGEKIGTEGSLKTQAQQKAIGECGGTLKFVSDTCTDVAVANEAALQGLTLLDPCGVCLLLYSTDITLLSTATFDAKSKAAYEACGGAAADWGTA